MEFRFGAPFCDTLGKSLFFCLEADTSLSELIDRLAPLVEDTDGQPDALLCEALRNHSLFLKNKQVLTLNDLVRQDDIIEVMVILAGG